MIFKVFFFWGNGAGLLAEATCVERLDRNVKVQRDLIHSQALTHGMLHPIVFPFTNGFKCSRCRPSSQKYKSNSNIFPCLAVIIFSLSSHPFVTYIVFIYLSMIKSLSVDSSKYAAPQTVCNAYHLYWTTCLFTNICLYHQEESKTDSIHHSCHFFFF